MLSLDWASKNPQVRQVHEVNGDVSTATIVDAFQILASVATAAAAVFAYFAVRENRHERIERDKPVFQFRTGEYFEAPLPLEVKNINDKKLTRNPDNRTDDIFFNVGSGTAVVLQFKGSVQVTSSEKEDLPEHKINLHGDSAVFAGAPYSIRSLIFNLNFWLDHDIDEESKGVLVQSSFPHLDLNMNILYVDVRGIPYTQNVSVGASVELYKLLHSGDRFVNEQLLDMADLNVESTSIRLRSIDFYRGRFSLQKEVWKLPGNHPLRTVTERYMAGTLDPKFEAASRYTLRQRFRRWTKALLGRRF